jgi:hypothetical protein
LTFPLVTCAVFFALSLVVTECSSIRG